MTEAQNILYLMVVSALITFVFVRDATRRYDALPHWGYLLPTFAGLWLISLPIYYAMRPLRQGERRPGGVAWNLCRFGALFSTLMLMVMGLRVFLNQLISGQFSNFPLFESLLMSVPFFGIWVAVIMILGVVGFLLREPAPTSEAEVESRQSPPIHLPKAKAPAAAQPIISVIRAGVTLGKFPEDHFRTAIATGKVLATDFYWMQGMADWAPVYSYKVD
jgi:hypothetical protein